MIPAATATDAMDSGPGTAAVTAGVVAGEALEAGAAEDADPQAVALPKARPAATQGVVSELI